MRALLTGFDPFDGATVNPSWEAVRLVEQGHAVQQLIVHSALLPCVFGEATWRLREAIIEHEPEVVVCVGQAGGREAVTVERVAINLDDARIPDNAGEQPIDQPVVPGGPAAYFSTLPVKACVAAARKAGVPASVSHSAGTFVCNHVFYGLMHLIATEFPEVRGGFVHVPYAPEQVLDHAAPSMPVPLVAEALTAIVTAALLLHDDLRLVGGAIH
ncbi:pyroglutamyl-peptidase I [Planobispora longispora]|uniref:Pyrrolidone-carboxylate peptidase n=1 Tax=Planobispora longispora TaxID=28887 RepID=A0A8J3RNZ9_9ACTN|nr:pyroglutamyl-peptidase I [Planobispora longispora]BFE80928.1 pyroglutamyl-peptidase I [Planobispora longispora]GIH80156.1 pyrrolidone-carboxylate peptidase [Planobispora longispora]